LIDDHTVPSPQRHTQWPC